jgi:hypothetical protein
MCSPWRRDSVPRSSELQSPLWSHFSAVTHRIGPQAPGDIEVTTTVRAVGVKLKGNVDVRRLIDFDIRRDLRGSNACFRQGTGRASMDRSSLRVFRSRGCWSSLLTL